ncbi:MAG: sulfurtransferase-like selenium metabolism protein YedF [Bacteroidales bacterium]|jgi:selenium metabolism protein YedF|nr:sulfurtransferase-like selenium metabolism protein YedF [Bacteroidales bacterium]
MRIVDTKGQECPAPIIATKKALRDAKTGETFKVLTDNQTSLDNLSRFLYDNKTEFSVEQSDNSWTITITKKDSDKQLKIAEEYCKTEIPHFTKGDFIIVFSTDKMGEGEEELGRLLMVNFIKAIKDIEHLPLKMVFYNNGVKLGSFDSPVAEQLRELEKMGVGLLFCATCVKFYHLEEMIKIGDLSNMFEIAQMMASSNNIVKP